MSEQLLNYYKQKVATADAAMRKIASYIETVQPVIDAQNERRVEFLKQAHKAVDQLVDLGIVQRRKSNELIDKIANDNTVVFSIIEKLAGMLEPVSIGTATTVKTGGVILDPFERLALTGSPTGDINTGMID